MAPKKINMKDHLSDGEIDLSMSDLQEVPVKEIAVFKKAYSLDLSNNHLTSLSSNFASLTHLTKLDLSKNELKELPENFGDLIKLKYLDLYQNQLQYLPLSFSKLKALKWLDLKDNPLVPAVAKVSGLCLDAKQCQSCAKDVVNFFVQVQEQITNDLESRQKQRQKQLEINQQKQLESKKAKKKEKGKQKQQNGVIKENAVKAAPKKSKNKNNIINNKDRKSLINPWKLIFSIISFIIICLFILTSIDFIYTRNVDLAIKYLFSKFLFALPQSFQCYCEKFGNITNSIHQSVGQFTLHSLDFVNNNQHIAYICSKTVEISTHFLDSLKTFIRQYI